ncbi:MAG: IS1634 family transposase, partial [Thermodesulfobium sp.]
MYIRPNTKTDKKNNKKYTTYELVQSYNTPKGPRQEVVLYLGSSNKLSDLTKEELKLLAKRIQDILYNRPRP